MTTKKTQGTAQESITGSTVIPFGQVIGFYADEGQKYDPKAGVPPKAADVVIIRPGESLNSDPTNGTLFYKGEAIGQAVQEGFWNGAKMFKDHSYDAKGRPAPRARRMDELVGAIETTRLGTADDLDSNGNSLAGAAIGRARFLSPSFAATAVEAAPYIGVSSAHDYNGRRYRAGNKMHTEVDKFTVAHSVDWVPFPAAGGAVLGFAAESEGVVDDEIDETTWAKVADLTPEDVKSHAPALYDAIKASAQEGEGGVSGDGGGTGQPEIKDGLSKAEVEAIVATALEAQSAKGRQIASAARQTQALVAGAGLPARVQARLIAQFDGSEEFVEATVQEAITDAKAELAEYKPPQMRGLGTSTGTAQEAVGITRGVAVPSAHSQVMAAFGIKPTQKGEGATK